MKRLIPKKQNGSNWYSLDINGFLENVKSFYDNGKLPSDVISQFPVDGDGFHYDPDTGTRYDLNSGLPYESVSSDLTTESELNPTTVTHILTPAEKIYRENVDRDVRIGYTNKLKELVKEGKIKPENLDQAIHNMRTLYKQAGQPKILGKDKLPTGGLATLGRFPLIEAILSKQMADTLYGKRPTVLYNGLSGIGSHSDYLTDLLKEYAHPVTDEYTNKGVNIKDIISTVANELSGSYDHYQDPDHYEYYTHQVVEPLIREYVYSGTKEPLRKYFDKHHQTYIDRAAAIRKENEKKENTDWFQTLKDKNYKPIYGNEDGKFKYFIDSLSNVYYDNNRKFTNATKKMSNYDPYSLKENE